MNTAPKEHICMNCQYFRNDPAFIEAEYKGLTALSSAYGSVRKDDGICARHDEYLSAYDWCDLYQASAT